MQSTENDIIQFNIYLYTYMYIMHTRLTIVSKYINIYNESRILFRHEQKEFDNLFLIRLYVGKQFFFFIRTKLIFRKV